MEGTIAVIGAFVARVRARFTGTAGASAPRVTSIEPRIRPLVDALNATALVRTFTSCEGHYGYRARAGDFTDREQANVGFFVRDGVIEEDLVRLFGKVLHEHELRGVKDAVFTVAKHYAPGLDAGDGPVAYFDFTVRPSNPHSSNAAKRKSTDDSLALITGAVERAIRAAAAPKFRRAEIEAILAAHRTWKSRLAAAVNAGAAAVTVEDAIDDDRCTIGKWLHGTPDLERRPPLQQIAVLHERFHREASTALKLALAARNDEAREVMDSSSAYARTSADLTRALRSLAA
jgi:hypothetical protein